MSGSNNNSNPLFTNPVTLDLPWQGECQTECPYGESGQVFDITYPETDDRPHAAVLIVTGYSDTGFKAMTGMQLREIAQTRSWARLLAASGVAAITYVNLNPVLDVMKLLSHLQDNAADLRLDAERLGVLSFSGNVPNALHFLEVSESIRCAALCYGFMRDGEEDRRVSEAAAQFRFVMPEGTGAVLAQELALLLVRAGRDQFKAINASIDRFVLTALTENRDLELINYPEGVHAFDVLDDSQSSQQLVQRILTFFRFRLGIA